MGRRYGIWRAAYSVRGAHLGISISKGDLDQ